MISKPPGRHPPQRGAQFGWGGLFADAVLNSGANFNAPEFTTITAQDNSLFLTGGAAKPYQVSVAGPATVEFLDPLQDMGLGGTERELLEKVRASLSAANYRGSHILERDVSNAFRDGFASNASYRTARGNAAPLATQFPGGPLGAQLKAVAETISVRTQLMASRQVFFVGLGGFDTHSAQATALPGLLSQIDSSMAAFHAAMQELGVANDVTSFTASDFGRTLAVNDDGTDHGWGGHHFVVGGAVNGGQIIGSVPPCEFGHSADSGGGRLIPSLAVEQYAAPLGQWFGLNQDELATALPNLTNFDALATPLMSGTS